MFSPLTIKKNRIEELDRFDNSSVSLSTSTKYGGLGIPAQSVTQGSDLDGTIVVQAWPNSDYVATTSGGHQKWHLWNVEGTAVQTWWALCIPTADNQLNVGGGSDYPGIDNTNGVLKGQIGVSFRQRPNGGANDDGIILLNSGSVYDWTDPQPITIAYTVDMTAGVAKASINGETATVLQLDRAAVPGATDPLMFSNLSKTASPVAITAGYSFVRFTSAIPSGSFSQFSYYTSSMTQDELNVITGQPYGEPFNVLDKQPQLYYLIREDEKVQTSGNTITGQLNGVFAYQNKGTETNSDVSQMKTVSNTANFIVTSGSVYDGGIDDYRGRI